MKEEYIQLLQRKVEPILDRQLKDIIEYIDINGSTPVLWKKFYIFILDSYKTDRLNRFSISQLANYFSVAGITPGAYIQAYAHGLYILALNDGYKIYGENFNI